MGCRRERSREMGCQFWVERPLLGIGRGRGQ